MQLSYAQNLEDYYLALVFPDLSNGTYVDVGGGHPVADNVTFHAYLRGWRGLVVEPQADLAALYSGVRPRDRVVSCLAGRAAGTIPFHVVEGLHGLSSAVAANAESARQYGAALKTIDKPVATLSSLIDEAGLNRIDVLKIDVEGAEPDVLAGLDLTRHRPRLILVEAVNPNNPGADVSAWEPALLAADYRFVFFDNLNRYYVATADAALAQRLPKEPAAWDQVAHLWDCGRVADRPEHPDRHLAEVLIKGVLATFPALAAEHPMLLQRVLRSGLAASALDPKTTGVLPALLGTAEQPAGVVSPATSVDELIGSDAFRAALGRIACMYDGGHLLE